jgi:hypothetical protein
VAPQMVRIPTTVVTSTGWFKNRRISDAILIGLALDLVMAHSVTGFRNAGVAQHTLAFCRYITYIARMMQDMVRPTDDPKDTTLQMRVSQSFLKSIDDWRRKQADLPSRAAAIRRLVEIALKKGK